MLLLTFCTANACLSPLALGVGLVSTLHIEPSQLAEYWEAYSLNKNVSELTDHTFQAYRNNVMKEADEEGAVVSRAGLGKRQGPSLITPPKRHLARDLKTPVSAVDNVSRVTMSPNKVTPHAPTTPAEVNLPSYGERKNAGQVMVSFNPNDLPAISVAETAAKKKCVISTSFPTNVVKPYRHMFTTLEERARALDDHLVTMGDVMVERYQIGKDNGIAEVEAVGVPRQDEVCCIGRICNEVCTMTQVSRHYLEFHLTIPFTLFRLTKEKSTKRLSSWKDPGTLLAVLASMSISQSSSLARRRIRSFLDRLWPLRV